MKLKKIFCKFYNEIKNHLVKKVQNILYQLSKPPPKFGEILVIWGLRQRVLRYHIELINLKSQ